MDSKFNFSQHHPSFKLLSREDQKLLDKFETAVLPKEQFHHEDHVKLAWLYLQLYPVSEVLQRYAHGIKHLGRAFAIPELYHETITWAYIFIINARMKKMHYPDEWWRFKELNEDIFEWGNATLIQKYYRDETLQSNAARKWFHLPDNIDFQFDF